MDMKFCTGYIIYRIKQFGQTQRHSHTSARMNNALLYIYSHQRHRDDRHRIQRNGQWRANRTSEDRSARARQTAHRREAGERTRISGHRTNCVEVGTRRRCQIRACFRERSPNLVGTVGRLLPQPPDLLLELPDLLLPRKKIARYFPLFSAL
jgi:hypothetical protein